jgi:hypothetical protein
MKHTFTREQIKRIIIEELEKSEKTQVEQEVDDLIDSYLSLDEEKKDGFFSDLLRIIKGQPKEEQEEIAEIALMRAQSRREALKKIGIGAAILTTAVGAGGYLKHLEDLALADSRQHRAAAKDFQSDKGYEGPNFATQNEFYLKNYEFSRDDIQSIDDFPAGSDEANIAGFRTIPTKYFISYEALADKPIPKLKATTGSDYVNRLMKFFGSTPSKPKMLYSVYNDYSKIGQVGYAGATAANITIRIRGMDQPVSVLPPEWTILFTFMTNAIATLDEKDKTRFETLVVSAEEDRYYRTQRGKHAAVQYGYYQSAPGTRSLKPSEREKLSPRTTETPYDQSNISYKYKPSLVKRGYDAAIKGKEYPGIPRRNEEKNP